MSPPSLYVVIIIVLACVAVAFMTWGIIAQVSNNENNNDNKEDNNDDQKEEGTSSLLLGTPTLAQRERLYRCSNPMSEEERAEDNSIIITDIHQFEWDRVMHTNVDQFLKYWSHHAKVHYVIDLFKVLIELRDVKHKITNNDMIAWQLGDCGTTLPNVLVKARFTDTRGYITLFDRKRHLGNIEKMLAHKIPFSQRINRAVWRGDNSGRHYNPRYQEKTARFSFVSLYVHNTSGYIDVGFVIDDNSNRKSTVPIGLTKPRMTPEEMAGHRYIVMLEGNDVASGLKWALGSGSVVLMPPPKVISFACETLLIPYYHYVPLNEDATNLLEVIQWCNSQSMNSMVSITENARIFIKGFLCEDTNNILIENAVMAVVNQPLTLS